MSSKGKDKGAEHTAGSRKRKKRTALMRACKAGRVNAVKMLLAKPDVDVNTRDVFGKTAAHFACSFWHDEPRVMELLASHGADMTARTNDDGRTPLHIAADWDKVRIASFLLTLPEVCNALDARDKYYNRCTAEETARSRGRTVIADMIATAERHHRAWQNKRSFLTAMVSRSRMQVQIDAMAGRARLDRTEEKEAELRAALLDGRLVRHGGMKYMSRLGGKATMFM